MNLPPNIIPDLQRAHSRRWFMKDCGLSLSLGAIALASLEARANPKIAGYLFVHRNRKLAYF